MALTPEDVVNKRFQQTKFREGYDQDEVDDFLDEIVVELRRLNQEIDDLRKRAAAAEARAGGAPVVAAPTSFPTADFPELAGVDSTSSNNLLQLARRLHEEHVREGIEKRDALVAEGQATAARVIAEAETNARSKVNKFDQERAMLENSINELRTFEREYRTKLRGYIEGQLKDLDGMTAEAASGR
jgi:DivIVA domain-containing protein